jgi:APA family basic amino acid/polyamine antiporter
MLSFSLPSWRNMPGIFSATALIFFVYIGFEDVANLSEESKNPHKTTPRALFISVIITSVIYVLVAIAFTTIKGSQDIWSSSAPLSALTAQFSPWRGQVLAIAALFATASTALISLVSISRMLFAMAREGFMPALLSRTLKKRKSPWIAALSLFVGACLFLPLGKVEITASVSSCGVLIVFMSIHIALIIMRFKYPKKKRLFRVPLSIYKIPIIPCVGILSILLLLTQLSGITYLIIAPVIGLGLLLYFFIAKTLKKT